MFRFDMHATTATAAPKNETETTGRMKKKVIIKNTVSLNDSDNLFI